MPGRSRPCSWIVGQLMSPEMKGTTPERLLGGLLLFCGSIWLSIEWVGEGWGLPLGMLTCFVAVVVIGLCWPDFLGPLPEGRRLSPIRVVIRVLSNIVLMVSSMVWFLFVGCAVLGFPIALASVLGHDYLKLSYLGGGLAGVPLSAGMLYLWIHHPNYQTATPKWFFTRRDDSL